MQIYPPSVTSNYHNASGAGLFYRMSTSFGTKTTQGYCAGSDCQRFAVAIGEFGSRFVASSDLQTMSDLAAYLNNQGAAADGAHAPITSWFYWAWNPDSGDTGGVVDDSWTNVLWNKVQYLITIGLAPWYS